MTINPLDWIELYGAILLVWIALVAAAVAFPALMKAIRRGL